MIVSNLGLLITYEFATDKGEIWHLEELLNILAC